MAYLDEQTQRINDMYANLRKQKIGELAGQKDQATTDLRRQLAEQLPGYQTARAQADVGEVQNLNKLKEYMASSGSFNSGDNLSRAGNILTQRANAVNQINGNENAFTLGVNNKMADANTAYNNNVNSVGNQLDTERVKAIEAIREQLRQEELQKQQQELAYQRQQEQQVAERAWQEQQAQKQYERQLAMQREQQAASLRAAQASAAKSSTNAEAKAKQQAQAAQQKALQDQYDKYYSTGWQLKNKGYKDADGNYVDRFNNDYMVDWVNNLDMPDSYKAKLANDLGLEEKSSVAAAKKKAAVQSIPYWGISPFYRG